SHRANAPPLLPARRPAPHKVPSFPTRRSSDLLRSTPERVYRAFLDADAMVKWLPPNGFTGKMHHLDAKVGGTIRREPFDHGVCRSEEHTSELQSQSKLVCRLLLENEKSITLA